MRLMSLVALLFGCLCTSVNAQIGCKLYAGDVTTLNFALTYEHFDSTFFVQGLQRFSQADFAAAGFNASTYVYLTLIRDQELSHVSFLTNTLRSNRCTAVPACTYNFSSAFASVQVFLATARILETTGVSAYDGSINAIRDADIRQAAATIATVEARHSAVLNSINGVSPFPATFDTPYNGTQVLAVAAHFIVSCPFNLTFPTPIACNYSGVANTYYNSAPPTTRPSTCQLYSSDLVTLNFALTLEHLEATFYAQAVAKFGSGDFPHQSPNFYTYLRMIAEQEAAHVSALTNLITAYGCDAVPACTYNFTASMTNGSTVVATAAVLEQTGVSAYDGAINTIRDAGYRTIAATIATVEGRHSAYLYQQNQMSPFPAAVDPIKTTAQVVAAVTPFIKSCPYTVVGPSGPVNLTCPDSSVLFQRYSDAGCTQPIGHAQYIPVGVCKTSPTGTEYYVRNFVITYANVDQSQLEVASFSNYPCSANQQVGSPRAAFNAPTCNAYPLSPSNYLYFQVHF